MPKVNYQYRNFELNSGPLLLLANTLDEFSYAKSQSTKAYDKNMMYSLSRNQNLEPIRKSKDNDKKASDYILKLAETSSKIAKGNAPNDVKNKSLILKLSKETSYDVKKLSTDLKTLGTAIRTEKIGKVDISLLRNLVKAIRETTVKEE
jgi:hypothetical protein